MFGLVRIIIGCVLWGGIALIIKNSGIDNRLKYYVISSIVIVALVIASAFVPLEDFFVTFSSPQAAYEYVSLDNSEIKLAVSGKYSDLVIAEKNGYDSYLIIPKTEDGWKVGVKTNTKTKMQRIMDGTVFYVYQYKDTSDYFVAVYDTDGELTEITDVYGSEFISLTWNDPLTDEEFLTYYANVQNLDEQYWVSINGQATYIMDLSMFESAE